LYKIDKTLIDNMNLNRSFIVMTPKETIQLDNSISENVISDEDEELSPAVKEKTRAFIQNANQKAQQIISDAQVQAQTILEEARREGYESGIAEGRQAAHTELEAKNEEVRDSLARVEAYRQDLYNMLESDVLSLAMDVAEKVINIAMERDDTLFKDIVKKAVAGIKHNDDLSIYISRAEYDKHFKDSDEWLEAGSKQIDVISDGNLLQGSCVVEADSDIVDAGIQTQLGKIRQLLSEQVE